VDPATQRTDPRATPPTGHTGRRPGYPVPVLPRPRPDEVPAPPLPDGARPPVAPTRPHPPIRPDGPRPAGGVAEPRVERRPHATPPPTPDIPEDPDELAAPPEGGGIDANGLAGWDLVRATQAGDQEAFGQLYDRYHEMVFRYVLFRVGDRQLAEDLTAETFLRALRRIASVSYQGRDIGAWFVTIARNLVLDHVKSSRYRLEQTTSEIADLSPSTSGPEQQVLDGTTHEELLRCVAKLNDDQKECIALRFLQGLSVAETARLMGRNEGAVKALQHRAVRRLAQLLPEGLR
jgi:RNA polymerase sigma-70 factor, ECF subfamily